MAEAIQLLGHGSLHLGMQMAGIQYADTTGEVDVTIAFHIPYFGVLGLVGKESTHDAHATRGCIRLALHQVLVAHAVSPVIDKTSGNFLNSRYLATVSKAVKSLYQLDFPLHLGEPILITRLTKRHNEYYFKHKSPPRHSSNGKPSH
jgi:hypothetical protein